jgi:EpsI family protein
MRSPILRYLPLLIFALGAAALLRIGGQADTPLQGSLDSIPHELFGYAGRDVTVSEAEQQVAGMDTYLMRAYLRDSAGFSLYVGYYEAQTRGKSIHSPKNCLPGAGWEPLENSTRGVIVGHDTLTVNRYVLEKGNNRAVVYYWYQGRGRVSWNEYAVKWELLRDKAIHGRSEEALVRIVVPIDPSAPERADDLATSVAQDIIPRLFGLLAPLGESSGTVQALALHPFKFKQ